MADDGQDSQNRGAGSYQQARESVIQRAMPIYVALLFALLTVALMLALLRLTHVLLLLFISVLFAAALAGPTTRMERWRVPRPIAAIAIYLVTLGVLVAMGWFVLPPLAGEVAGVADLGPEQIERYERFEERYEELRESFPALRPLDEQVSAASDRVVTAVGNRLLDLPIRVFTLFLDVLAVFFISILLLTNRERLLALVLSLTHPRHRAKTEMVLTKMWQRIGAYLRAKAIVMIVVAAITYAVLMVIGVPFALLLAILVGLGQLVPRVGPWVARIPLLGIAALEGPGTFGLVFLSSIVIENLKGYVISPFVEGSQLDIHPLLVFVAVLTGGALLGPAGAFVAVPGAAIVQVLFEEVVVPWRKAQLAPDEPSEVANADSE